MLGGEKTMEQARKNLKISSIVVLVFAGVYLVQIVAELLYGKLNHATIPEGAPENLLLITKIILFAVSLLFLLPQVYVGVRGLRIAKNPTPSKGHIVWAVILLVLAALGLIEPVARMISRGGAYDNVTTLFSLLLEVTIYLEYINYARAVRKACC